MKIRSSYGRIFSGAILLAIFFTIAASADEPMYKGKAAAHWIGMLSDPDPVIRSQAFNELTRADRSGGGILLAFLGEPSADLRSIAAMGLHHMAPVYPETIPALTEAVLDVNLNVRYWALSALKEYGKEARSAVPNIIKALETFPGKGPPLDGPARYYADMRALAADALGSIGPDAKAAVPTLENALQDSSPMVQEAATRAIKSIKGL
jgi:HEAT repeat protein